MKLKNVLILLISVVMILGASGDMSAYTTIGGPASIASQGTVPFLGPQALLDNFNQAATLNAWNCLTGAFSKSTVTPTPANENCTASYSADTPDGTGYSLKLDYNVSQTSSYDGKPTFAGYYSQLGGGSLTTPTVYTAVSFWVKGSVGGEFFKVEIKNNSAIQYSFIADDGREGHYSRNAASAYITDFLDGGVTPDWQKVTIPFHNFVNMDGFSSMKELVFVFENSQSLTNGSLTQGTIYIDNIMFETASTAPVPVVRIDPFGDKLTVNSFGGNMGVTGGDSGGTGALSFASISDANHTCLNALKYDFKVLSKDNYTAAFFIFGGGNDAKEKDAQGNYTVDSLKNGWIKISHDFSAYNSITFWARAADDNTNPSGFKVELHDFVGTGNGEPFYKISAWGTKHLTTAWQKYTIPLASFKDWSNVTLDKGRIAELVFTIENNNQIHAIGAMYIDDVQFE